MNRTSGLMISLGLNVAFAAAIVWLLAAQKAPTGGQASTAPVPPPTSLAAAAARATDLARGAPRNDPRAWIGALREAGVPESVLTRLIATSFEAQWEKRRSAVEQQWARGEIDDDAWAQFNRQHDVEEEAALRSAMGDTAFLAWHKAKLLAGLNLDRIQLSPDESDAIYALRKDLLQQRDELDRRRRAGKIDDSEIADLQDKLDSDYEAKTKALLGDDRYATLHRGNDTLAGSLRRNLQTMNVDGAKIDAVIATEEQWRERRQAVDSDAAHATQLSPEAYQARLQALDIERDTTLQHELGPDAYEQLQQLQDDRYRKLTRYSQLWGLDAQEVRQVYDALRNYSQSVEEYRREALARGVNWDNTQQAIDQFRDSTAASLRAAIGDEKYQKLSASEVLEWDR